MHKPIENFSSSQLSNSASNILKILELMTDHTIILRRKIIDSCKDLPNSNSPKNLESFNQLSSKLKNQQNNL
jgi:hypothetical protein